MNRPPDLIRRLFARLLPGELGAEACAELESEWKRVYSRRGGLAATFFYATHLLRPSTWALARALKRREAAPTRPSAGLAARLSISSLDVKLGLRMLLKHPGLTAVGGLSLAFGVWVSSVTFEVVGQMLYPDLPLDEGDRIVAILHQDLGRGRPVAPLTSDHAAWAERLRTFEELGAFRDLSRNLIPEGGHSAPIRLAEISPAGFRVPRVPPLMGRGLIDSDAAQGAPPVIVLSYEVWDTRLGADPAAVGSTVELGGGSSTIVGVMPPSFGFPVSHDGWVPLPQSPASAQPGEGTPVVVFGRLAGGSSREAAQAELDAVGMRRAAAFPQTLGHLRPRVIDYTRAVSPLPDIGPLGLVAANLFVLSLFVLICGSVALLVWARAATRAREIAVRSALGAGRGRIAMQLFTEALVLSGLAAFVGLLAADFGVGWYADMMEADSGRRPFWIDRGIGLPTVAWLVGLMFAGAALVGLVPALQVSGRNVDARIRHAARTGGLRLGGTWGKLLAAQIAVTLAFPASAFFLQRYVMDVRAFDLGLGGEAYVAARLEVDVSGRAQGGEGEGDELLAPVYTKLEERLLGRPDIVGVTFAVHPPDRIAPRFPIDLETQSGVMAAPRRVGAASVDVDFFREVGATIVSGRGFMSSDPDAGVSPVVVNESFVESTLGGRSAVGNRFRLRPPGQPAGPWLEIVGVVADLTMFAGENLEVKPAPGFYRPVAAGAADPLHLVVQLRGRSVDDFLPELRGVGVDVDPDLRLQEVRDATALGESLWRESEFLYRLLAGVSLVAVMLSLAVIYTVLSLTVSQRTREIGVRVALGSNESGIVMAVFRQPLVHVGVGVGAGGLLVGILTLVATGGLSASEAGFVALYSLAMVVICALACVVPTRRALSIEPVEALRVEG